MPRSITMGIAAALAVLANAAFAGDCYNPPENDPKLAAFCYKEFGLDISVRAHADVPTNEDTGRAVVLPGVGFHYDKLDSNVGRNPLIGKRFELKAHAIGPQAFSISVEGDISVENVICPIESHCIIFGGGGGFGSNANNLAPFVKATLLRAGIDGGYFYTKNNKTFIVRALGGFSSDYNPKIYPRSGQSSNVDVGVSAAYYMRNNLALMASIMRHIDVGGNTEGGITEGRLRGRIRLFKNPDDMAALIKDVSLLLEVRAYEGEYKVRDIYNPQKESVRKHVTSLMGEAGMLLEF